MITILKPGVSVEERSRLVAWLSEQGIEVHISEGGSKTILGLIGDTHKIDEEFLKVLDIVESVKRIGEPYKNVNRKFHSEDTVVSVGGVKIGGGNFAVIAGPCSIESEEQIVTVARQVKAAGATMLRGGAFKPRTSPYDFQGMRSEGLKL